MFNRGERLTPSKKIAYSAVAAALLIGGQLALSAVAGVEIVTVLLLCFSYVFGIWCGVFAALTFSLLRCFIFGFYPSAVILYLIYYPLFALLFGALGKIGDGFYAKRKAWFIAVFNVFSAAMIATAIYCAATGAVHISPSADIAINTIFYILAAAFFVMLAVFDAAAAFIKTDGRATILKVIFITGAASVCTIFFTLLDDVITPLVTGMTPDTALTYFFVSFTAMLPQTVCTLVTVSTLFMPLTAVMRKVS